MASEASEAKLRGNQCERNERGTHIRGDQGGTKSPPLGAKHPEGEFRSEERAQERGTPVPPTKRALRVLPSPRAPIMELRALAAFDLRLNFRNAVLPLD